MQIKTGLRRPLVATLAIIGVALLAMTLRLPAAQEDVLQAQSDTDLSALRAQEKAFQAFGLDPFDGPVERQMSPDAQALQILDDAAGSAASNLRAVTDLLAIYDNMQCGPDRATVKLLLDDRLRLYSRLLGLNAESAAIPIGHTSLPATSKKALKLHDDLLAAKNRLDSIVLH